jgi:putative membrane protein
MSLLFCALFLAQVVSVPPEQAPLTQGRAPVTIVAPPDAPGAPNSNVDLDFSRAAVESSRAEIAMAELALARSHTDEVRSFAQNMISEHMGLMHALAPAIDHVLPGASRAAQLSPADELTYYHLQHAADVDFDHTYALAQVGGHIAAYGAFTTEEQDGRNARLKQLAREWRPTITAHLQLAVEMAQHVGGDNPIRSAQ